MIILNKVCKKFLDNLVVDRVFLKIHPGEIVGLLGPNGAGKTTTIRMIAGILPQTSGVITIDGKSMEEDEGKIKKRIGYLPENNPLYEEMTVEEYLRFFAEVKEVDKTKRTEVIEKAVESTGINDVYYRFIGELSKGYRQRVGLAQAILNEPDILLLDEPTEGLDPNQRREIQTLLGQLGKSRTVIVSSHVLGEISKLANRVIIIHKGKVVGDDTVARLVQGGDKTREIEVEIVGKEIVESIKKLNGVLEIKLLKGKTYRIIAEGKKDIREDIFKLAVKKKWILLSMRVIERQLEDVFTELTEN